MISFGFGASGGAVISECGNITMKISAKKLASKVSINTINVNLSPTTITMKVRTSCNG